MKKTSQPKLMGRYIITDPKICHGQMAFRGTRILVSDVFDQVADGLAWESIIEQWHGHVTKAAIAEAVQLAGQALAKHAHEFVLETKAA